MSSRGRTLEQIAKSEDHVWNSKDTATGKAWYRKGQSCAGGDNYCEEACCRFRSCP